MHIAIVKLAAGRAVKFMGNQNRSLSEIVRFQASERPDKVALQSHDVSLSYAELDDLIRKCASALVDRGVWEHETCGISFASPVLFLIVRLALSRLQVCSVSLSQSASPYQTESTVKNCGIGAVIADRDIKLSSAKCIVLSWSTILKTSNKINVSHGLKASNFDTIAVGSGSTGSPKLIGHTVEQLSAIVHRIADSLGYGSDQLVASLPGIEQVMSQRRAFATFLRGGTFVLHTDGRKDVLEFLQEQHITSVATTVFHAEKLLEKAHRLADPRLRSMRLFEIGSAYVSEALIGRIKKTFTDNVLVQYGTNECPNVCDRNTVKGPQVPSSIGHALAGTQVQIIGDGGQEQPHGHPGQIRMRAAGMALSYVNDSDNSAKFFKGGWFYPGDIGKKEVDGQVIYLGRSDHMMIFNGINIYPAEIERVMADHPAVKDVAVMPMRHPVHQHVPMCGVTLISGESANEQELIRFGQERLGARRPQFVFILEAIPRNDLGKLRRKELARLFSENW